MLMHLVLKWVNTQFPQVAFDTLLEGGCNWKFGKRGIVTLKNAPSFSFRLSPFTATNVMKGGTVGLNLSETVKKNDRKIGTYFWYL